ncbi:hypothetical protein ACFWIW_13950 [Amycolatopsis sp. NPDC058340]|uniref:hypothetical protein n=1 Tax=Amycolatopsis sp. NPDC058340 TaxID=3346453 RepID=UPI0036523D6C
MSGRPEAGGDAWNASGSDLPDDWEPWRPGDPSTIKEAPASYAASTFATDGIYRPSASDTADEIGRGTSPRSKPDREPRKRWWTEGNPRKYGEGDKVKSREAIGGPFMCHVEPGTRGEVVGKRSGLFGDEYLKVKFANGYTEEVKPDAIQRDTWF